MLKKLIESFDDEQGLPENTFEATRQLIEVMLGVESSLMFSNLIDATEGRFYSKVSAENLLEQVFSKCELTR